MSDSLDEKQIGLKSKTEEKVRKQLTLTEFFDKISADVRKCRLCEKLVRASQGKQTSLVAV